MSYVIEEELGAGPVGPIRRATADRLGARPIALRLLPLDDAGFVHLRRHAEALAGIGHPHLGLIDDVFRAGDDAVGVATTLGTETLRDRMGTRAPGTRELLAIIGDVSAALDAAHRAGLAHGSVHAGNVVWAAEPTLRRPAGVPILVDLGLGRFRDGSPAADVEPSVWRTDRRAMVDLARSLVASLGRPATTRAAALAELVDDRGEELVDDPHGLRVLACECERIGHRPDLPVRRDEPEPAVSPPADGVPCPAAARPRRRPRWHRRVPVPDGRRVLAGAALAIGLVAGTAATLTLSQTGSPEPTPAAHRPGPGCDPMPERSAPVGAQAVSGFVDLDADGCAEALWWSSDDAVLHVDAGPEQGPERFRLGQPGDRLLVGDWNCDGDATPAIYRPGTGETFRFDRWAAAGTPVDANPGPVLAPDAVPHTDADDDGCDRIVVAPPGS